MAKVSATVGAVKSEEVRMRKQKRGWKYLLVGGCSVVVGLVINGRTQQVCADEACGDQWGGNPSSEPRVTWVCDPYRKYVVHPVSYKQTVQNPCEGTTAEERNCSYSLEVARTEERDNDTPDDPDDDYLAYIFRKTDSCRTNVSGEVASRHYGCCSQ